MPLYWCRQGFYGVDFLSLHCAIIVHGTTTLYAGYNCLSLRYETEMGSALYVRCVRSIVYFHSKKNKGEKTGKLQFRSRSRGDRVLVRLWKGFLGNICSKILLGYVRYVIVDRSVGLPIFCLWLACCDLAMWHGIARHMLEMTICFVCLGLLVSF